MFEIDYWPASYFAPAYWPDVPRSLPDTGGGGVYFAPGFWASDFFAPTYFPGLPGGAGATGLFRRSFLPGRAGNRTSE